MPASSGAEKEDEEIKLPASENISMCAGFCVYLMVIPCLFVLTYHAYPTTALLIVGIFALTAYLPLILNKGDMVVSKPVGPCLSCTMLACVALMFLSSMYMYWAHVLPLRALHGSREYRGVYPQMPAADFPDATFLKFVGNTSINVDKKVSLRPPEAATKTFCAAPIMNKENLGRVSFWAVGIDCCGEQGDGKFECGEDTGALNANGFVLPNPSDPLFQSIGKYIAPYMARRDIFKQAIAKAERKWNLVSTDDALLVVWTTKSREEIYDHEAIRITIACLGFAIFSANFAWVLMKIREAFTILRIKARIAKWGQDKAHATSRMHDFIHEMDEQSKVHDIMHDLQKERTMAKSRSAKFLAQAIKRPPLSKWDIFIMGIVIPYLTLLTSMILITFSGCYGNTASLFLAPFFVLLGIFIMSLLATPHRVANGFFMIVVTLLGTYLGTINYNWNMYHYCAIEDSHSYDHVSAYANTELYGDGGILNFDKKAYLSQNHSVGFLYQDVVYCAAPILSHSPCKNGSVGTYQASLMAMPPSFLQRAGRMQTNLDADAFASSTMGQALPGQMVEPLCIPEAPKRVEFWAIGLNCCSMRKDFRCDGGREKGAHSAIVIRDNGVEDPGGPRDQFHKAIAQATKAYGLPTPENTLLVRWGEDAKNMQEDYRTQAMGLIILTAIISGIGILTFGVCSYFYLYRLRKREILEAQQSNKPVHNDPSMRPQGRDSLHV
jgi:hypothetical protein